MSATCLVTARSYRKLASGLIVARRLSRTALASGSKRFFNLTSPPQFRFVSVYVSDAVGAGVVAGGRNSHVHPRS
jgi:hypothetical protein